MANVSYWFSSWVSAEGNDLWPGETHDWVMWGFNYGDAITVTAHPVVLQNALVARTLYVSDVRVESDLSGNRLYFSVTNTGNNSVPGYGLGFSMISN